MFLTEGVSLAQLKKDPHFISWCLRNNIQPSVVTTDSNGDLVLSFVYFDRLVPELYQVNGKIPIKMQNLWYTQYVDICDDKKSDTFLNKLKYCSDNSIATNYEISIEITNYTDSNKSQINERIASISNLLPNKTIPSIIILNAETDISLTCEMENLHLKNLSKNISVGGKIISEKLLLTNNQNITLNLDKGSKVNKVEVNKSNVIFNSPVNIISICDDADVKVLFEQSYEIHTFKRLIDNLQYQKTIWNLFLTSNLENIVLHHGQEEFVTILNKYLKEEPDYLMRDIQGCKYELAINGYADVVRGD